jgi:hypothetical protein
MFSSRRTKRPDDVSATVFYRVPDYPKEKGNVSPIEQKKDARRPLRHILILEFAEDDRHAIPNILSLMPHNITLPASHVPAAVGSHSHSHKSHAKHTPLFTFYYIKAYFRAGI